MRGISPTMVRAAFTSSSASRPWVTTTIPIMRFYPCFMSRCSTAHREPGRGERRAIAFAIITERCRPPVQPMAMVR